MSIVVSELLFTGIDLFDCMKKRISRTIQKRI